MPKPVDVQMLKKGTLSERERQRVVEGLENMQRGLALFAKAHEVADSISDTDSPVERLRQHAHAYQNLTLSEAKAGLFNKAQDTAHQIVTLKSSQLSLHELGKENFYPLRWKLLCQIAQIQAEAGYPNDALATLKPLLDSFINHHLDHPNDYHETADLLRPLDAIVEAQKTAREDFVRTRAIILRVIAEGMYDLEKGEVDSVRSVQAYTRHGFIQEAQREAKNTTNLVKRLQAFFEIYTVQPSPETLNVIFDIVLSEPFWELVDSPKYQYETIDLLRSMAVQLAERGDTQALRSIDQKLYSDETSSKTRMKPIFTKLFTDYPMIADAILHYQIIAGFQQGASLDSSVAQTQKMNPVERYRTVFDMAVVEANKGHIDNAFALMKERGSSARTRSSQLFAEEERLTDIIISEALAHGRFTEVRQYIKEGNVMGYNKAIELYRDCAIAMVRDDYPVDDLLTEMYWYGSHNEDSSEYSWKVRINAEIFLEKGELDKAEEILLESAKSDVRDSLLYRLAVMYLEREQPENAGRIFQELKSTETKDELLLAMIEYCANHGEDSTIQTYLSMMSSPNGIVKGLASAGEIFFHDHGLPMKEVNQMTSQQAHAVVLEGNMQAISVLKILRPDLMQSLDSADGIAK